MIDSKIVWLVISTLVTSTAYALIAPFVPYGLMDSGSKLGFIGVAFCAYPLMMLLLTPLLVKVVPTIGNTNMISVAIAFIGAMLITFGFLTDNYEGTDSAWLIILTMTLRLV